MFGYKPFLSGWPLLAFISIAGAATPSGLPMPPFKPISESIQTDSTLAQSSPTLVRTIELPSGDVIELTHTVTDDGNLELDASRQSTSTLDSLDAYCSSIGAKVSRDGVTTLTRGTVALLACVGEGRRPGAANREATTPQRTLAALVPDAG